VANLLLQTKGKYAEFVGLGLQCALVNAYRLCDCPALMASSSDPLNKKASCSHQRLLLEEGQTSHYLSGHYVCEQCGLHFDRPPLKQEQQPPKNQEPPQSQ